MKTVKRFVVFGYDDYYPEGGWSDMKDAFDTLEEAWEYACGLKTDYREIVDLQEGVVKEVCVGGRPAGGGMIVEELQLREDGELKSFTVKLVPREEEA